LLLWQGLPKSPSPQRKLLPQVSWLGLPLSPLFPWEVVPHGSLVEYFKCLSLLNRQLGWGFRNVLCRKLILGATCSKKLPKGFSFHPFHLWKKKKMRTWEKNQSLDLCVERVEF
jgi:hypothetical protein